MSSAAFESVIDSSRLPNCAPAPALSLSITTSPVAWKFTGIIRPDAANSKFLMGRHQPPKIAENEPLVSFRRIVATTSLGP